MPRTYGGGAGAGAGAGNENGRERADAGGPPPEAADDAGGAEDEGGEPHAIWSGVLTFGLVSVPVDLFPGLRGTGIALHTVTEEGVRLRRQFYCPEEDRAVPPDELVRGAALEDGSFVRITDEELEALAPERSREIDLRRFVGRDEIPAGYFVRPYILTPGGESAKAYRLLAAVMEQERRAGIATFVMRGKEYLIAILAEGGILRAETLRFPGELRGADQVELPERPDAAEADVGRMMQAIEAATERRFPWETLRDEQEGRLREVLEDKRRRGVDVLRPGSAGGAEGGRAADELDDNAEVIDIMQVLKDRLAAAGAPAAAAGGSGAAGGERGRGAPRKGAAREQAARKDAARAQAARKEAARKKPGRERPARTDDLAGQSREELYRRAQELDVPGRSAMTKEELVVALRERSTAARARGGR